MVVQRYHDVNEPITEQAGFCLVRLVLVDSVLVVLRCLTSCELDVIVFASMYSHWIDHFVSLVRVPDRVVR